MVLHDTYYPLAVSFLPCVHAAASFGRSCRRTEAPGPRGPGEQAPAGTGDLGACWGREAAIGALAGAARPVHRSRLGALRPVPGLPAGRGARTSRPPLVRAGSETQGGGPGQGGG